MKPTVPALLRAVEQALTGYVDRVRTQEETRYRDDVTPPRDGAKVDLLIRRPRRSVTHAELLAVANRFLDDIADSIAPPIGAVLDVRDDRPAVDDEDDR